MIKGKSLHYIFLFFTIVLFFFLFHFPFSTFYFFFVFFYFFKFFYLFIIMCNKITMEKGAIEQGKSNGSDGPQFELLKGPPHFTLLLLRGEEKLSDMWSPLLCSWIGSLFCEVVSFSLSLICPILCDRKSLPGGQAASNSDENWILWLVW